MPQVWPRNGGRAGIGMHSNRKRQVPTPCVHPTVAEGCVPPGAFCLLGWRKGAAADPHTLSCRPSWTVALPSPRPSALAGRTTRASGAQVPSSALEQIRSSPTPSHWMSRRPQLHLPFLPEGRQVTVLDVAPGPSGEVAMRVINLSREERVQNLPFQSRGAGQLRTLLTLFRPLVRVSVSEAGISQRASALGVASALSLVARSSEISRVYILLVLRQWGHGGGSGWGPWYFREP